MASSAGAAVRTEEGGPDGTGVTEASVTAMLQKALEPTVLKVTDDSDGCGAKFSIVVVSTKFDGVSRLERQRMVHGALGDDMAKIHAVSMKAWTPAQYEKKQAKATA